jgi:hypothetical protein
MFREESLLYLANPCGSESIAAMRAGLIGFIDTPKQGNKRPSNVTWAADNGCFGKGWPGDKPWMDWLRRQRRDVDQCLFATAPDVVGDAAATLERSRPYLPLIRQMGYPAALVAQNGLEDLVVPWGEFDVLFIGGIVECPEHGPRLDAIKTGTGCHQRFFCPTCEVEIFEWKLGPWAALLAITAKSHGKRVHMGRVNSLKRYRYAVSIGCDSVDGTYLVKGARKNLPNENLPKLLEWVDTIRSEVAA